MEEEEVIGGAFFPAPPPFYKHFTAENLDALKQIKEANADSNDGSNELSAAQIINLPPKLRYLIPPEPPSDDDTFRVFETQKSVRITNRGRYFPLTVKPAQPTCSNPRRMGLRTPFPGGSQRDT